MKLSSGQRSNFNYEQSHDIKPTVKELQLQSEMIESIREQSERRSAELSECRRELATVRASLSLAETGKMAMERENEKLNFEVKSLLAAQSTKESELLGLRSDLHCERELLAETKKELEMERKDNAKSSQLHRELYNQAQRATGDATRRLEDLKIVEKDLEERAALHKSLSRENAQLSSEVTRLRNDIRAKTQQLSLAHDLQDVNRKFGTDKMKMQISQLLEEKSIMLEEISTLRLAQRKFDSKIKKTQRKLGKLVTFIEHQQLILEEKDKEMSILRGERDVAKKDSVWQAHEQDSLRQRFENKLCAADELKRRCEQFKDQAMRAKATATAERNSISYECEMWKKKAAHAEVQLNVIKSQSAAQLREFAYKVHELTQLNGTLTRRLEADRKAAEQLRTARMELIGDLEKTSTKAKKKTASVEGLTHADVSAPLSSESPRHILLDTNSYTPKKKKSPIAQLAAILDGLSDDGFSTDNEDDDQEDDRGDALLSTLIEMESGDDDDEESDDGDVGNHR